MFIFRNVSPIRLAQTAYILNYLLCSIESWLAIVAGSHGLHTLTRPI